MKKCLFSSLQTISKCQAEYPLKTYIFVAESECLIALPNFKILLSKLRNKMLIQLVYAMKELNWWP